MNLALKIVLLARLNVKIDAPTAGVSATATFLVSRAENFASGDVRIINAPNSVINLVIGLAATSLVTSVCDADIPA